MGLLDRIKQALKLSSAKLDTPIEEPPKQEPKPKSDRSRKAKRTTKDLATERGEPYIAILSFNLDPENLNSGSFELDWNDKFITNLVRAGYQVKPNEPENDIVDRWFQTVCRNVVLEYFEQEQADPDLRRLNRKKLDNERTEFS